MNKFYDKTWIIKIFAGVMGVSLMVSNVSLADGEADSRMPAVVTHAHQWGEWEVVDDPQCETAGEQARTCVTCGYTETAEISAVGHVWGEWETVKDDKIRPTIIVIFYTHNIEL